MDKNFIENCKLLKRHFTKLTQADTTAQSKNKNGTNDISTDIINAKQLLLTEKLEELSEEDISLIKEESLVKYEQEFKKYATRHCCKKENIKWNDEIFLSPVPHPKYNSEYLKSQKTDKKIDNERKDILELASIIFNKYDNMQISTKLNSEGIQKENEVICKENETLESNKLKNISFKTDINNETKCEKDKFKEITCIPELEVTSQKMKDVDFLQIKKLNIEDTEKNENFDSKQQIETARDKVILIKTLDKWKKYTIVNKTLNIKADKKIDNFLENLQKFQLNAVNKSKSDLANKKSCNTDVITTKIKTKSSTCLDSKVSSFENRFRAQKDIIEMQKQKIEEQNKLIEDLKLNKIKKDTRDSFEQANKLRKNIMHSSKNYKFKTENKTTNNELENDEKGLDLSLHLNKAPKIVKMMEDRARERHERRLVIQERKRLIEEEKKRQAEELVQRKIKEEIEEKQKRIEKVKKQREIVRQLELRKQVEKKRFIKLFETVTEHYKTKLKKSALEKLKILICNMKIKSEIAKRFYENNIILKCFKSWYNFSSEITTNKNKNATYLYTKSLMYVTMSNWKAHHLEIKRCNQVAIDLYEMNLQLKFFVEWHKIVCINRIHNAASIIKADNYYRRILLYHCFENWRSLPAILQIERIQNERRRKWRLRVAEILSDYDPLKNYNY